jgi:hypothetical protein
MILLTTTNGTGVGIVHGLRRDGAYPRDQVKLQVIPPPGERDTNSITKN